MFRTTLSRLFHTARPRTVCLNLVLIVAFSALVGGCSTAELAKKTFLEHQKVSQALLYVILDEEEKDSALVDKLYAAEDALIEACKPFNEAVSRRLEQKPIDDDLRYEIYNALVACAEQTALVKRLLQCMDLETVTFYFGTSAPAAHCTKQAQ